MVVFKIKNLATGLFYRPYRIVNTNLSTYQTKTNLSKNGKLYSKRPSLKFIGDGYYSHFLPHTLIQFVESEWEIQEIS